MVWSPTALRPWHLPHASSGGTLRPSSAVADFGRRRPKRTLLRQGYGGYPPRIHPRVYTRGFLRRRVKLHFAIAKIRRCRSFGIPRAQDCAAPRSNPNAPVSYSKLENSDLPYSFVPARQQIPDRHQHGHPTDRAGPADLIGQEYRLAQLPEQIRAREPLPHRRRAGGEEKQRDPKFHMPLAGPPHPTRPPPFPQPH